MRQDATHLQVVPDHLLENEVQFSVRDVAISVHIIDLERDCRQLVSRLRIA